jgi:aryl-alcohol dehydrogenase-like predicted oxidoreductase
MTFSHGRSVGAGGLACKGVVLLASETMDTNFLQRDVKVLGGNIRRVGLAASYGIDAAGVEAALEGGINYVFWNPTSRTMTAALRNLVPRRRDKVVIATGPSLGFFPGSLRRRTETVLKLLKTDYLDVLQLFWLGITSAMRESMVEELVRLKQEGKVRALGVSIHDRVRAGKLAEEGPLDVFMVRYNAAHPGAEKDIFPHLAARHPAVVAYTATSWRKLLKKPRGWTGPVPTAGDCYRFCLSSPHVDVVLTGPASRAELDENLRALEKGPLSAEEMAWMREFGRVVHG